MRLVFSAFVCLALVGCEQRRATEVREFPAGFHGPAVIVWEVPSYPAIQKVDGKLIEKFSTNGTIITSSKQQYGWAHDEEYFVDGTGHRLPSKPEGMFGSCGTMTQNGHTMIFETCFVGTNQTHTPDKVADAFQLLYGAPNK
jgi:hypothetical protein